MNRPRHIKAPAAALSLLALLAPQAHAADLPLPVVEAPAPVAAPARDWALQVSPYLWAASLKGDISPFRRGPTIGIEKPFSEVFDELNLGGFLHVYGRYGRFVGTADILYVDTTDARQIAAIPGFGPTPGLGASVDSTQFTATVMGGYQVFRDERANLALLAGARAWHVSNDVTVRLGSTTLAGYDESFGWVDPVIGARGFLAVTDRLSLQAQADIGGFGAASDFTWQALATLNFEMTEHLAVSAGYKVLDVDYDHDGHVFDTRLQGPVLGLTYRF